MALSKLASFQQRYMLPNSGVGKSPGDVDTIKSVEDLVVLLLESGVDVRGIDFGKTPLSPVAELGIFFDSLETAFLERISIWFRCLTRARYNLQTYIQKKQTLPPPIPSGVGGPHLDAGRTAGWTFLLEPDDLPGFARSMYVQMCSGSELLLLHTREEHRAGEVDEAEGLGRKVPGSWPSALATWGDQRLAVPCEPKELVLFIDRMDGDGNQAFGRWPRENEPATPSNFKPVAHGKHVN